MPLPNPVSLPFLQPRERTILLWLSRGWSYKRIAEQSGLSMACIHVHCHHIRQKTGIVSTKGETGHRQCRAFVLRIQDHPEATGYSPTTLPPISPKQMAVLRMVAQDHSYAHIARTLNMGLQTAQNHASQGCKRAGISARTHWERLAALKAYLKQLDEGNGVVEADPMF